MKERIPDTTSESILSFLHFEHPTNEQTNVLIALEDFVSFKNDADFMIVSGSAGTGKSSIMNAVVKYAEAQSYRVQTAAPTARAARLIAAKTDNIANTLHSLLFSIKSKNDEAAISFLLKADVKCFQF